MAYGRSEGSPIEMYLGTGTGRIVHRTKHYDEITQTNKTIINYKRKLDVRTRLK